MTSRKIAIQTQLWGNDNLEKDFEPIFNEVLQAGYDGVECRFTVLNQRDRLESYLESRALTIVGVHASLGVFLDEGRPNDKFFELVQDMKRLNVRRLLLSGGKFAEYEPIYALADECARHHIELLYHNHAYEFEHGYRMFDEIVKHPGVGLALDIGWLYRAGVGLEPFLNRYGERIRYFHIKDTTRDQWKELGTGDAGMREAIRLIERIPMEWWTVEQDDSTLPALESATISRTFLSELGY